MHITVHFKIVFHFATPLLECIGLTKRFRFNQCTRFIPGTEISMPADKSDFNWRCIVAWRSAASRLFVCQKMSIKRYNEIAITICYFHAVRTMCTKLSRRNLWIFLFSCLVRSSFLVNCLCRAIPQRNLVFLWSSWSQGAWFCTH